MASLRNPKTWAPYINTKDCSQGFCSLYCPQWCYIIFPPPPPFEYPDEDSGSMFSPLVIAIIGLLASSFLLVSYYAIVTKYCKDRGSTSEHQVEEMEIIHQVPALHESWHFTANNGLDEALIQLITVCEYKRGDGLVEGTECSVCLSKFDDGERLRLLPKCSHAFHLPCIDMWLKSHSNCPLCRAGIISVTYGTTPPPAEAGNSAHNHSDQQMQPQDENAETSHEESGIISVNNAAHKGSLFPESHMVVGIHVRDRHGRPVRRSISMGYFQFPTADSLCINQEEEAQQEEAHGFSAGYGSKALHCVLSRPIAMKRSLSSGIFFSSRHNSTTIPF